MKLIDVLNSPWALPEAHLREIQEIYKAHILGPPIDLEALAVKLGKPLNNQQANYENVGGTAVLPVHGVMGKRMNLMTQISGGASTQLLSNYFAEALADPDVHSILLHVDSPGGTVDGTETLANNIFSARGKKPIVAFADGRMQSAAMWVGSAADKIYAAERASQIGSIGVVASHADYSKAEEKAGVKITEITAGKYKRIASEHAPLTAEGHASIKERVDALYTIFVDDLARNRGVSSEFALENMADGKEFAASDALKAKLIDGIKPIGEVIAELNANAAANDRHRLEFAAIISNPKGN